MFARLFFRLPRPASPAQVAFCIFTLETVLVRTGHCLPWKCADVLPFPASICLCTVDGLQASTPKWPGLLGAPDVFLGVHHGVRGDPRGKHYPSCQSSNVPQPGIFFLKVYGAKEDMTTFYRSITC